MDEIGARPFSQDRDAANDRDGYNLFLDDFRTAQDAFDSKPYLVYNMQDWVIVRSYDEFVNTITKRGVPKLVSLDHDLADVHYDIKNQNNPIDYSLMTEKTGYHCAQWLIQHCIDNKLAVPTYIVHSANPAGLANIKSLFDTYRKLKLRGDL